MKRWLGVALLLCVQWACADDSTQEVAKAASPEWRDYVTPLAPIGERLLPLMRDPDDPQLRQELYRFLYSQISSAYMGRLYADAEHPDFWPFLNQAYNTFAPNPDASYYMTPIDGKGFYRISGFRGTVRIANFQIGGGTLYPLGTGSPGDTYANYDLDRLPGVKKDGTFDVLLSAERPAGYKGNWWKLDPRATYIIVRQFSYDWLREQDGRFAIERVDRPAIKPRQSAEQIDANLRQIPVWVETWTRASLRWLANVRAKGLVNKVSIHDNNSAGGVLTQKYIEGLFELEPGEALVYETEMPKRCRYWNLQITDALWSSIDWMNRQTSLNGHSARIDRDGRLRIVISAEDPGVPNWIDTAGYKSGALLGRWTECSSAPTPTVTKINLADVRKALPADTPTVTAEARDAAIRERRKGAQLRRRW
jgi:hypothetical protein